MIERRMGIVDVPRCFHKVASIPRADPVGDITGIVHRTVKYREDICACYVRSRFMISLGISNDVN